MHWHSISTDLNVQTFIPDEVLATGLSNRVSTLVEVYLGRGILMRVPCSFARAPEFSANAHSVNVQLVHPYNPSSCS